MTATVGTGLSIAFSTGFLAEIISVSGSGISREPINTSHMGTTVAHTFTPSTLFDAGELAVELAFDPATKPPITGAAETVTITMPDAGAATWAASGFLTSFEYTGPLEERMTATATIKFSGDITVTP